MANKEFLTRIKHKRDTSSNWTQNNPVILNGEIILVDTAEGELRAKIGDGVKTYTQLPFSDEALRSLIDTKVGTAIDNATADDFGIYVQDTEPTDAVAGDIWVDTANDPSYIPPTIPEVTEADNGKVLMVVNGTYQLVTLNLSVDADGVLSV